MVPLVLQIQAVAAVERTNLLQTQAVAQVALV